MRTLSRTITAAGLWSIGQLNHSYSPAATQGLKIEINAKELQHFTAPHITTSIYNISITTAVCVRGRWQQVCVIQVSCCHGESLAAAQYVACSFPFKRAIFSLRRKVCFVFFASALLPSSWLTVLKKLKTMLVQGSGF